MREASHSDAPRLIDLAELMTPDPDTATDTGTGKRVALVRAPGLTLLHLTLEPGQRVPLHRHPGHQVVLQGLIGVSKVQLEEEVLTLGPHMLLAFPGERAVSPYNDGAAPSALLITLVRREVQREVRRAHEEEPR